PAWRAGPEALRDQPAHDARGPGDGGQSSRRAGRRPAACLTRKEVVGWGRRDRQCGILDQLIPPDSTQEDETWSTDWQWFWSHWLSQGLAARGAIQPRARVPRWAARRT